MLENTVGDGIFVGSIICMLLMLMLCAYFKDKCDKLETKMKEYKENFERYSFNSHSLYVQKHFTDPEDLMFSGEECVRREITKLIPRFLDTHGFIKIETQKNPLDKSIVYTARVTVLKEDEKEGE